MAREEKLYDVYTWYDEDDQPDYYLFKEGVTKKEALSAEDEVLSCTDTHCVKTVKHKMGVESRKINVW